MWTVYIQCHHCNVALFRVDVGLGSAGTSIFESVICRCSFLLQNMQVALDCFSHKPKVKINVFSKTLSCFLVISNAMVNNYCMLFVM